MQKFLLDTAKAHPGGYDKLIPTLDIA